MHNDHPAPCLLAAALNSPAGPRLADFTQTELNLAGICLAGREISLDLQREVVCAVRFLEQKQWLFSENYFPKYHGHEGIVCVTAVIL